MIPWSLIFSISKTRSLQNKFQISFFLYRIIEHWFRATCLAVTGVVYNVTYNLCGCSLQNPFPYLLLWDVPAEATAYNLYTKYSGRVAILTPRLRSFNNEFQSYKQDTCKSLKLSIECALFVSFSEILLFLEFEVVFTVKSMFVALVLFFFALRRKLNLFKKRKHSITFNVVERLVSIIFHFSEKIQIKLYLNYMYPLCILLKYIICSHSYFT